MSIYSYNGASVVDKVIFRKTANGGMRAYLHAQPSISASAVTSIKQALEKAGYEWTSFALEGKPMLEVRGFKREDQLLKELSSRHWIKGAANKQDEPEDRIGWGEWLKKRTLQFSGLLYLIGDYNFIRYGHKQSKWEEMLAGVMYCAGTSSLVFFGRNDQSDVQVKELSKKIGAYIMKESAKLPPAYQNMLFHEESKKLGGKAIDLFRHYPSEMFNLFTGLAGACVTAGAIRHKLRNGKAHLPDATAMRRMKLSGWLDVGLGTMTMAATAIGGLVDEKAHDPDAPRSQGAKAILDWVRERPLTIAGAGLMASTMCHAASTLIDLKEAKRLRKGAKEISSIKNRGWFVATNLAAEFLIAISSKGHGQGVVSDTSVDDSAIAIAADLIVKQPVAMHERLIDYMGRFLGQQDVLAIGDKEGIKKLREQVEAMRRNPWAQAETTPEKPAIIPAPDLSPASMWQAKLAAQEAAAAPLQLSS